MPQKKYILVRFQVAHGFAYGFVKISLHVFNMEACFCCGKEMKNVYCDFYLKIQAFSLAILSLYPTDKSQKSELATI